MMCMPWNEFNQAAEKFYQGYCYNLISYNEITLIYESICKTAWQIYVGKIVQFGSPEVSRNMNIDIWLIDLKALWQSWYSLKESFSD